MKEYEFLKIDVADQVCTLTISAPKSLNALNSNLLKEMDDFLSNLDPDVRVLIVTGDGDRSFVAGADISGHHPRFLGYLPPYQDCGYGTRQRADFHRPCYQGR